MAPSPFARLHDRARTQRCGEWGHHYYHPVPSAMSFPAQESSFSKSPAKGVVLITHPRNIHPWSVGEPVENTAAMECQRASRKHRNQKEIIYKLAKRQRHCHRRRRSVGWSQTAPSCKPQPTEWRTITNAAGTATNGVRACCSQLIPSSICVHTRSTYTLTQRPGRKPGACIYTRNRLSLTLTRPHAHTRAHTRTRSTHAHTRAHAQRTLTRATTRHHRP